MNTQPTFDDIKNAFITMKTTAITVQPLKIKIKDIENQQRKCLIFLENMQRNDNYQHLDQLSDIQEKYRLLKQYMQNGKNNSQDQGDNLGKLKKIFGQKSEDSFSRKKIEAKPGNAVNFVKSEEVQIPDRSRSIDLFFKKKEQQISKKQASFKMVLESKQFQQQPAKFDTVSDKSMKSISRQSRFMKSTFKTKQQERELQLKLVVDEHKKRIEELQKKIRQDQQLNQFQKNLLKQQKNRYFGKIDELEHEIQQLYRDNFRLKQLQKSSKADSFQMQELVQKNQTGNIYSPYVIKTRTNDLNLINQKNQKKIKISPYQNQKSNSHHYDEDPNDYLGSKLEQEKPRTAADFFNIKKPNFGLFQQKFGNSKKQQQNNFFLKDLLGQSFDHQNQNNNPKVTNSFRATKPNKQFNNSSINSGNHFDTFQLANSLSYARNIELDQSRQMIKMNSATCTRNKVAFFKNSLILLRQDDLQIAYKRSQLNKEMNKQRIILYINNKTNQNKKTQIVYDYQAQFFKIQVLQQLKSVNPNSQGRQVIQITLISKQDLNAVTDMHIVCGNTSYDFWLPACFIVFKTPNTYRMRGDQAEMTIVPDRQFSSYQSTREIIPTMEGGNDGSQVWAYLFGDSCFGNHPVKLTWRPRELTIEASQKWIDFLGFVFHFFK